MLFHMNSTNNITLLLWRWSMSTHNICSCGHIVISTFFIALQHVRYYTWLWYLHVLVGRFFLFDELSYDLSYVNWTNIHIYMYCIYFSFFLKTFILPGSPLQPFITTYLYKIM
jgi:hypothetical protein